LDTATVKGKCRKLSPSWKGPVLVIQRLSDHLYHVRTRKTVKLTNHDRMKKCEDRDMPRWLLKARESQALEIAGEDADPDKHGSGERCRSGLRPYVFLPIATAKVTVREGRQRSSPWLAEIPLKGPRDGRCVRLKQDEVDMLDRYFCPGCPTVSLSLCRYGSDSEEEPPRSWRAEHARGPSEGDFRLIPARMEGSRGRSPSRVEL
jgi:hypothetical protein